MGKLRAKSFMKAKKGSVGFSKGHVKQSNKAKASTSPILVKADLSTLTVSPIKSNVAAGRVSKSSQKKKSVTFRSNLTDIVSVDDVFNKPPENVLGAFQSTPSQDGTKQKGRFPSWKIIKKDVRDKKSRMNMRKKEFLQKIELMKLKKQEEKAAAKRKATPIVGDTQAMLDALVEVCPEPSPMSLQHSTSISPTGDLKNIPRTKKRFSTKKRQQDIAEGLAYFAGALQGQDQNMSLS